MPRVWSYVFCCCPDKNHGMGWGSTSRVLGALAGMRTC